MKRRFLLVGASLVLLAGLLAVPGPEPARAAFPGENGKIVFEREGDIWTINPDGSDLENLTNSPQEPYGPRHEYDPAWSPDGTKIVFSEQTDEYYRGIDLFVMNADGSGKRCIACQSNDADLAPSWAPDGERVVFAADHGGGTPLGLAYPDEPNRSETLGEAFVWGFDPAWSPDGRKIAFYSDVYDDKESLYTVDADGTDRAALPAGPGIDTRPDWSPDGQRLIFTKQASEVSNNGSTLSEESDIYSMDASGGSLTRITDEPGAQHSAAYSPDGEKITYVDETRTHDSTYPDYDIRIMNADGSGSTFLSRGNSPDWQPRPADSTPPADTAAPDTAVDGGPPEITRSRVAEFAFSSDETGSSFECSLDGAAFSPCDSPKRYSGLEDGKHAFRVRAADATGNADLTPALSKWTVDTRAPRISKPRPGAGSVLGDRTPRISAVVRDGTTELARRDVRLFVDGKSRPFTYDRREDLLEKRTGKLSLGKHRIRIVALDEAGNRAVRYWVFRIR